MQIPSTKKTELVHASTIASSSSAMLEQTWLDTLVATRTKRTTRHTCRVASRRNEPSGIWDKDKKTATVLALTEAQVGTVQEQCYRSPLYHASPSTYISLCLSAVSLRMTDSDACTTDQCADQPHRPPTVRSWRTNCNNEEVIGGKCGRLTSKMLLTKYEIRDR